MLESWFVSIKIFINLSGSYWVGNLIKFGSFLLRGWGDEAVTGKFATSLLVSLPSNKSSGPQIQNRTYKTEEFEFSTMNDLSGRKVEDGKMYVQTEGDFNNFDLNRNLKP